MRGVPRTSGPEQGTLPFVDLERTGEGQRDLHGGACTEWALQREPATKCLRPVGEPYQAGAAGGVRAATAVATDANAKLVLTGLHVDVDRSGPRVLGGVGQRLGNGM